MALSADAIRQQLGMKPHPEGGSYVETFRDSAGGLRGYSTAIYYLLEAGEVSAWHRLTDSVEIWHWYGGAPLELSLSADGSAFETITLGLDLEAGQRPQAMVPVGCWQTSRSLGDWTLCGCSVAPGFLFTSFEVAPPGWQPGQE